MNIVAAIRREQRELETQVSKLQRQLGGLSAAAKALGGYGTDGIGKVQKRVLSAAAARAKISAAAKRRWAKVKAGSSRTALTNSATERSGRAQKRVMSAAARARISRAMKQRWAKVRAGAKKAVT
jgi:hypothetical protein